MSHATREFKALTNSFLKSVRLFKLSINISNMSDGRQRKRPRTDERDDNGGEKKVLLDRSLPWELQVLVERTPRQPPMGVKLKFRILVEEFITPGDPALPAVTRHVLTSPTASTASISAHSSHSRSLPNVQTAGMLQNPDVGLDHTLAAVPSIPTGEGTDFNSDGNLNLYE